MKLLKLTAAAGVSALLLTASSAPASAVKVNYSDGNWRHIGYAGDLDRSGSLNTADLVLMAQHLLGSRPLTNTNSYYLSYDNVAVEGHKPEHGNKYFHTADLDRDGSITAFDMVELRQSIANGEWKKVWVYVYGNYYRDSMLEHNPDFIYPAIQQHTPYMPSQGTAKAAVFYVDFPDCQYTYEPDTDYLRQIVFGGEDPENLSYPFESIAAFYSRSSKDALSLEGDVFRYTAKNSIADYCLDHGALLEECLLALDDSVDFSQYDGNSDNCIDVSVICVPDSDYSGYWWPAAVEQGWNSHMTVDGMNIGHMISGTMPVESAADHYKFVYTNVHEMGHAMGLPDYYVYNGSTGMSGTAGWENMDDSMCDMGALSKLMLGWYKKEQVSIFDPDAGSQTFVLKDSQSTGGNCVIIPNGTLEDDYEGEFFIMEYNTPGGNNTYIKNVYLNNYDGLRIFHADTEGFLPDSPYGGYLFDNHHHSTFSTGKRFIRLVNGDAALYDNNYFTAGDVVDSSVSGFCWYDDYEGETIDPGISVTVDSVSGDECIVTISVK